MSSGNLLQPKVEVRENGEHKVIDLAVEKLFIRRSMDDEPSEREAS
jgi:hypothetical protein